MRDFFRQLRWLVFISLMFLSFSCSEDNENPIRLSEYEASYMFYPGSILFPESEGIVKIHFNNGRVTKRVGGLLPLQPATGYDFLFSDYILDDVTWTLNDENKTTVVRKDELNVVVEETRTIFFEDEKIKFIASFTPPLSASNLKIYDTTFFYYNSELIIKTEQKNWTSSNDADPRFSFKEIKNFTYEDENLVKIEGRRETRSGIVTTTVEIFQGYDTAPNPTKPLIIFKEVFYRSLSKNNFTEYNYERRNNEGNVLNSNHKTWVFKYNGDGIPTFKIPTP